MSEESFSFPYIFWLPLIAVTVFLFSYFLSRKRKASIALAIVTFFSLWIMFETVLSVQMEQYLAKQSLYAALFKDFPQDKAGIVAGYAGAFRFGGNKGVIEKRREEQIVAAKYLPYYIENTPTETIISYIKAKTWLLSTLFEKDKKLCQAYLSGSVDNLELQKIVGDEIFLRVIRHNPRLIEDAFLKPEPVSDEDKPRSLQLYNDFIKVMQKKGADFTPVSGNILSCETTYREFYELLQMPPSDAALIIKLLLGKEHLQNSEKVHWLQKL